MCSERRLRSAGASEQSDQSYRCKPESSEESWAFCRRNINTYFHFKLTKMLLYIFTGRRAHKTGFYVKRLTRTWSGKKKKWQSGHRSAYVCTESADMKKPWDSPRPAKTQIRFRMLSLFRVMTGSICIGYIFYNVYLKLKCLSFFNVISCLMVCILENNNNILFNNHSASMRRFHFH